MKRKTTSLLAASSMLLALCALVLTTIEDSEARKPLPGASLKPKKLGLLRLNKKKKFPASVIPKVRRATNADRVGGRRARALIDRCSADTVDLGTVCLMSSTFPLAKEDVGKNNYFFAAQKCTDLGGYLPTAAQLIGAAPRVKLSSTVDDDEVTALIDLDPSDGLRDRREMSGTLISTAAGGRAAGSQGVSEGSRGDPRAGEPDPAPQPANPAPETLQYVTVYDNREAGGFAGGKPVAQAESFRCAFNKAQGNSGDLGEGEG